MKRLSADETSDIQQRMTDLGNPRAPVPLSNASISLLGSGHWGQKQEENEKGGD